MKYKLPSNKKQLKFLKQLINKPATHKRGFIIDKNFFSSFPLKTEEITQILNALNYKGLIEMYPPSNEQKYPFIEITQKAFAYIPEIQETILKFWIPILASSVLSVVAIIVSVIALLLKL